MRARVEPDLEIRDNAKVFKASELLIGPLLALLPMEPAAADPLATLGEFLTRAHAYPEALTCIDAIINRASNKPLGAAYPHWSDVVHTPMTRPRQQALLCMYRAEALFAAGERDAGEAAFAEGARHAQASGIPSVIKFGGPGWWDGTIADKRLWSLYEAAKALRLRYEGKDACAARKVKKRKANEKPDPSLLSLARAYLDDALAVLEPRVASRFAGLEPTDTKHPAWTYEHDNDSWPKSVYIESGLLYEQLGDLESARLHLGRAKWLYALYDPAGQQTATALVQAVERLGIVNTPLAT